MSHSWRCDNCGRSGDSPAPVFVHRCPGSRYDLRRPPNRAQERTDWARRLLGAALVQAIEEKDATALLRHVDEEDQ